jgi:hypothetical protein
MVKSMVAFKDGFYDGICMRPIGVALEVNVCVTRLLEFGCKRLRRSPVYLSREKQRRRVEIFG